MRILKKISILFAIVGYFCVYSNEKNVADVKQHSYENVYNKEKITSLFSVEPIQQISSHQNKEHCLLMYINKENIDEGQIFLSVNPRKYLSDEQLNRFIENPCDKGECKDGSCCAAANFQLLSKKVVKKNDDIEIIDFDFKISFADTNIKKDSILKIRTILTDNNVYSCSALDNEKGSFSKFIKNLKIEKE